MRPSELIGRGVTDTDGGSAWSPTCGWSRTARRATARRPRVRMVLSPGTAAAARLRPHPYEGPWLVRTLVRAYNQGTRYVPWDWFQDHAEPSLRVDRPLSDIPHLHDIPGRRAG